MMICIPSRMCIVTETTVRMRRSATSGWKAMRTASSHGLPTSITTMITNATMSGTFDTAVMRCSHQCSAPWPAAPSPFTRASGVRRSRRVSARLSTILRALSAS